MTTTTTKTKDSGGLEGVVACNTRLSDVDGNAGRLIFSGFNAVDLAESKTVEEVWFLLHEGRLPTTDELSAFKEKVQQLGVPTKKEIRLIKSLCAGEPLSAFRSIISAIASARGYKPWLNRDLPEIEDEILSLAAWRWRSSR